MLCTFDLIGLSLIVGMQRLEVDFACGPVFRNAVVTHKISMFTDFHCSHIYLQSDRSNRENNDLTSDTTRLTTAEDSS